MYNKKMIKLSNYYDISAIIDIQPGKMVAALYSEITIKILKLNFMSEKDIFSINTKISTTINAIINTEKSEYIKKDGLFYKIANNNIEDIMIFKLYGISFKINSIIDNTAKVQIL